MSELTDNVYQEYRRHKKVIKFCDYANRHGITSEMLGVADEMRWLELAVHVGVRQLSSPAKAMVMERLTAVGGAK